MLQPWALNHKRLKKRIAWAAYQRRDLKQARCHIATSETEAQNLQHLGLGVPVVTVPNGIDVPEFSSAARVSSDGESGNRPRTALFLGRIYPVKGLPMLVEAWSRVRPQGWVLKIAGPDEAGHRKQVEKAIATAQLGDVVSFVGPVERESKRSTFLDADLFVLPTLSESFGVVIAEALAHGLPVLTTTAAPWPDLPELGCGWWVEPTVNGLEHGLRRATILDRATLRSMGENGRALVIEKYAWDRVAKLTLSTYSAVVSGVQLHPQANVIATAH
jgi:glycosyltransferase involved in cell wall biosynthesis